jgi:phosphoglycerol transferase MdoB-like AlkP superfamily enzyme
MKNYFGDDSMTTNISPTPFLIFVLTWLLAAAIGTIWYARRPALRSIGASVLVVFAWLAPVLGPVCLLIFLAAAKPNSQHSPESHNAT